MDREPGEVLNPSRMSIAEGKALKARIAPHVFASQYQQRPEAGGTGYCSIERLARYAEAPPFELIVHSWDIASTKGGGDWTVCAKFGLAKKSDGRDILYLTGIVRMQVELPDVREAIIAHDTLDKPAIIVMDGNGIGRGPYQDLWARGFRHLLPGESMTSSASDNLKIRRFSEGIFSLYDGLVRLPSAMPGRLETLLAEIAAFPDGKHDDQVDALSYVAAYRGRSSTTPVAGASSSVDWCCRRSRFRSSRPNRATRSSAIGDAAEAQSHGFETMISACPHCPGSSPGGAGRSQRLSKSKNRRSAAEIKTPSITSRQCRAMAPFARASRSPIRA